MKNLWVWLMSRRPHRCYKWAMYWEDESDRGLYCACCGKILGSEHSTWIRPRND